MYFVTYKYNNEEQIGILSHNKESVIPLRVILNKLNIESLNTMNEFIISSDEKLISKIEEILNKINFDEISISDVVICAPVPYPIRNLICLGKNYLDHAKEVIGLKGSENDIPKFPIYFSKIANPAIGDKSIIKNHSEITDKIDYEVELGIIIGKDGINIKEEDAEDYIFGYTIVNDISARNIQRKHGQWFKGKCLDTFCPMGPHIVHKNQIPFPVELDIVCKINDEVRQNSNTRNMIFDIPYIISDLSKGMHLKAGDIIITGTPSGVGLGFKPFKFLKSGDKIECFIEKIGTLTNYLE